MRANPSTSLNKLTPHVLAKIRNNKKDFCRQCKKKLKVNEMYVGKRSVKSCLKTRNIVYYFYYHEECARRLLIID
jgi:tRNA(Ile2) C34 agmatinyltransferase TiaS